MFNTPGEGSAPGETISPGVAIAGAFARCAFGLLLVSMPGEGPDYVLDYVGRRVRRARPPHRVRFSGALCGCWWNEGLAACRRCADAARASKYCSEQGTKKEHSLSYVTDEQRSAE
ncbi:hypothetical protein [Phaeodactylibacter xiamenensis]|uniref:hypothetical protein n=1 Tax=Phaeodactylibacter xiamenensis TaxID=1524460 RepID=UPI0024A8F72E|nr:hypothetical protein [Phaeodactylibacter xiamenensis]